jgi:hypothetical protein
MSLENIINLHTQKAQIELEIDERIEKEIRDLCTQFNNENKDIEFYAIGGMGGFTFYLQTSNKDLKGHFNDYYPNFDELEIEIERFNENAVEYLNDEWAIKEHNVDINKFYKLIFSDKLKNKYSQLINTINEIKFDIESLSMDSRKPTEFKILNNDYENNIKDEKFLDLLSKKSDALVWSYSLARNLVWYENSYPLVIFKDGAEQRNLVEILKHNYEKNFITDFNYENISSINKQLILESNLFNNTSNTNDCKIEVKKTIVDKDTYSFFNKIRNDLKISPEKAHRLIYAVVYFGKPSEITSYDDKLSFLKNAQMSYYHKELINNNEKNLFDDFKNPIHVLTRDEQFVLKNLQFIEDNFDSFKTAKENTSKFDNFTIIISNAKDNTSYEKEFKSFSELNNYMLKKEETFLDNLIKNYESIKKYESPKSIDSINNTIEELGGNIESVNKKTKRKQR